MKSKTIKAVIRKKIAVKDKDPNKVNSAYLIEILDRMF